MRTVASVACGVNSGYANLDAASVSTVFKTLNAMLSLAPAIATGTYPSSSDTSASPPSIG